MAAMHVYNQAFTYKNYGTGQAEALILFVVCAIVGVTQGYIGKKKGGGSIMDENKKAAQKKKVSHFITMAVLVILFLAFIFRLSW